MLSYELFYKITMWEIIMLWTTLLIYYARVYYIMSHVMTLLWDYYIEICYNIIMLWASVMIIYQ